MGNSGGIPDIGVRLSAQGVQDVVNAFARVRQEGKKTGTETAASLELINGALEQMQELLPALSFAIVVDKLVDIGLSARETAEDLGKLSDKTGAAIGTLSALNLAAHDNEVSQESLSNGLIKLAKNQQDASNGSVKQLKAFKDLGITINDLKTQDPGQLFVTVAQKMDALSNGSLKAQVAMTLFGKSGAELIPMLNSLGVDGFDAAVAKAKKLGLYLDTDMVASAMAAQDALHEVGDIANGLATRFDAGFAPGFAQGVEMFAEALEGDGIDSMQKFGESAAQIFKGIIASILFIGDTFKVIFKNAASEMTYEFGQAKAGLLGLAQGGVAGAVGGVMGYNAQNGAAHDAAMQTNADAYFAQYAALQAQYSASPDRKTTAPHTGGGGATGNGTNAAQQAKTAQARAAYLQSLADNELAIEKTKNQLEESEDKRHYDAGVISVDQYYDKVEARIQEDADAQTKALQAKLAGAESMPQATAEQSYKRLQAIGQITTQMAQVQLKETADLAAAELNRSKAKHDQALAELNDTEKLQKASGDKYGAEETALEIEIQRYTELLEKEGKSVDEIDAAVSAYQRRAQATIDFGRNQEASSSAMSDMNLGIGSIQNQAASGSISNVAAQAQINQLQQSSLATLSAIGLQMFQNAVLSEDPKAIDAANQYNAGLQKVAASLKNVTTASVELTNQLTSQGYNDFVDFFTAGISGAKSFGDALTDLGNQFAGIVSKMVSQLLVYYALSELVGWIAPNSAFASKLNTAGPFGKYDDGGWTGGQKGQAVGIVHGEEFVIKAGPAAQYRPFLEAINAGKTPSISSVNSAATAHTDSYTASLTSDGINSSAAPAPLVQVINTTGQQSSQKKTTGSGGQSITQIIIGAVATDIAKGGQVAQSMQSNYGVTRQGVKRG